MTRDTKIIVLTVFNTLVAVLMVAMMVSMFYPVLIIKTDHHRLTGEETILLIRRSPEQLREASRLKAAAYEQVRHVRRTENERIRAKTQSSM